MKRAIVPSVKMNGQRFFIGNGHTDRKKKKNMRRKPVQEYRRKYETERNKKLAVRLSVFKFTEQHAGFCRAVIQRFGRQDDPIDRQSSEKLQRQKSCAKYSRRLNRTNAGGRASERLLGF